MYIDALSIPSRVVLRDPLAYRNITICMYVYRDVYIYIYIYILLEP